MFSKTANHRHQTLFELAPEDGICPNRPEELLIHGCVQSIETKMRIRIDVLDTWRQSHRDASRGMHRDVEANHISCLDGFCIEFLNRKVEALHLGAFAFQPGSWRGDTERLAA